VGRLTERLDAAAKALVTFRSILSRPKDEIVRDASIQRFEYTFEAVWKAAQLYLRLGESLEVASPKAVIRASFQTGLLTDPQARTAMQMADDRNLTVHTYNEDLAEEIYSRLPDYSELMSEWHGAIRRRLSEV
jgi:nucleotidyltransferase substrate binding protein (TIGR01987 family)